MPLTQNQGICEFRRVQKFIFSRMKMESCLVLIVMIMATYLPVAKEIKILIGKDETIRCIIYTNEIEVPGRCQAAMEYRRRDKDKSG